MCFFCAISIKVKLAGGLLGWAKIDHRLGPRKRCARGLIIGWMVTCPTSGLSCTRLTWPQPMINFSPAQEKFPLPVDFLAHLLRGRNLCDRKKNKRKIVRKISETIRILYEEVGGTKTLHQIRKHWLQRLNTSVADHLAKV